MNWNGPDGTIAYLWLGEGPDRTRPTTRVRIARIVSFYAALADSARTAIFPDTRIGTLVTPVLLAANGKETFVRSLRRPLTSSGSPSSRRRRPRGCSRRPRRRLKHAKRTFSPGWRDRSRSSRPVTRRAEASGIRPRRSSRSTPRAGWLALRSPLDPRAVLLVPDPRSKHGTGGFTRLRRFPSSSAEQAQFAGSGSLSMALRRLDGSPKLGRQVWFEERP